MSIFKKAIKLTFGRNKFGKRTVQNLLTRKYFWKKSRDQIDKIIDRLYLQKASQCKFQIYIMPRNN